MPPQLLSTAFPQQRPQQPALQDTVAPSQMPPSDGLLVKQTLGRYLYMVLFSPATNQLVKVVKLTIKLQYPFSKLPNLKQATSQFKAT